MQLRSPAAEQLRRAQVSADQFMDVARKFGIAQLVGMLGAGGRGVVGFAAGERGFEKAAQRIERVMPGVALALDEGVEHSYAGGDAILRAILEGSRERSTVGESLPSEERIDLDFRVNAWLHAAVDFQDESVSEHDRAIALLGFQNRGSEIGMALAPNFAKGAVVGAHEFSEPTAKTASSRDSAEKSVTKSGVVHGAIENSPAAILSLQLRYRHIRQLFFDLLSFLADCHRARHDVDLRIAFDIVDLPQQDLRRRIRHRNGIEDIDGANDSILALKPAARFEEGRQAAQKYGKAAALKDFVPRLDHDQREAGRCDGSLNGLLVDL